MKSALQYVRLSEFGQPQPITGTAVQLGITPELLRTGLRRLEARIARALNVSGAVAFGERTFQMCGIAGICNLSANTIIEVCPKFLDAADASWKEDFLFVATFSAASRLLPRDVLSAALAVQIDLSDVIARSIAAAFNRNERRPLRTYRHRQWYDFSADGEVDPEAILLPTEEGLPQAGLRLARENPFNAVILEGIEALLRIVRHNDTRRLLTHVLVRLSPQRDRSRRRWERLPSRHRRWQDLYEICQRLRFVHGASYSLHGAAELPGFLIKTADTWEQIVRQALRAYFRMSHSVRKGKFRLGEAKHYTGRVTELSVFPDVCVFKGDSLELLVDAKYKSGGQQGAIEAIARADAYEAVAYLQATNCSRAILVYPEASLSGPAYTGATSVFQQLQIGAKTIIGMRVSITGISRKRGYARLVENLGAGVAQFLSSR